MKSLRVFGRDAIVIRFTIAPLLTGHHVADPEWIGFMMPLSWEGDYRFNGQLARPGSVFLTSSPDGYFNIGKKRETLMFAVRRSVFVSAYCALAGVLPETVSLSDQQIVLDEVSARRLQALFETVIAVARSDGSNGTDATIDLLVETDLIAAVAGFLSPSLSASQEVAPSGVWRNPAEIVRRSEVALSASPDQMLGLSDLCQAAGVGVTRLSECFHEIYGVSPGQYLKQARLTNVRQWLLDEEDRPRSVKLAARTYGFRNNGRFAKYYFEMFGEMPSETLARTAE